MSYIIGRAARLSLSRVRIVDHGYSSFETSQILSLRAEHFSTQPKDRGNFIHPVHLSEELSEEAERYRISSKFTRVTKVEFLAKLLTYQKNNKEDIYGTLDTFASWEENFPIGMVKWAMKILMQKQKWHKVVQVIKWILSKGHGNTMYTYGQLIEALDMDKRSDEAHKIWEAKFSDKLQVVPWQLCKKMMGIYYRDLKFDRVVELFEKLEKIGRRPPEKEIVNRVATSYELLGRNKEKLRVLNKYSVLYSKKYMDSEKQTI